MICILKLASLATVQAACADVDVPATSAISDWLIAGDVPDARRQAHAAGMDALAAELYQLDHLDLGPAPGKYKLRSGYVLLVS